MNEGKRLAEAMGEKRVLFMAHHGVVVVGPNVAEAMDDLYYFAVSSTRTGHGLSELCAFSTPYDLREHRIPFEDEKDV